MRLAGFYNLSTKLTATAASAQAAVTVESTAGFMVGQVVTLRQATGAATESKTILTINNTTNVITMSTNLSAGFAVGDFLTAGEFGATAHGARKPQMNLAFTEDIVNCITLAHWTPAHRQTLDDVPVMRNLIDTELVYGLALTEEWQILQGPGTGGNLLGFMNNTLIQNQGTMTGAGIQQLDWVRKALTKSLIADYPPNGIVVNPIDWEAIELLKDSQGRYLYLDINPGREPNIWKIPAVVSNSMPVNNFLLGAFALGADLYDRETTTIRFAEQHEDYVVRNAVLVLAEERIGLGVKRPLSFVKGRFA
jgi:HK97 family phage major capsid protein